MIRSAGPFHAGLETARIFQVSVRLVGMAMSAGRGHRRQESGLKVFDLSCEHEHHFEGWFSSADDFEQQRERKLIECPLCGSREVKKLLSAPRLNLVYGRDSSGLGEKAAAAHAGASGKPSAHDVGDASADAFRELQGRFMRGLRKIFDETEDVGARFAEEARRIHFNEAPARPIRGTASAEDTQALRDEGIEVLTLPVPPALKNTLQ